MIFLKKLTVIINVYVQFRLEMIKDVLKLCLFTSIKLDVRMLKFLDKKKVLLVAIMITITITDMLSIIYHCVLVLI